MNMNKQAMLNALRAFINQRSGIDFRNYQSGNWKQSRECFLGDYRPILRHGKHARTLLRAVELRDSITAEHILEASRNAYSGRLQWCPKQHHNSKTGEYTGLWEYTTGQYFPTEYRNAACAVLARVLWYFYRDCLGKPDGKGKRIVGIGEFKQELEFDTYAGKTAGEAIQSKARAEFGPAIARTWFN